MNAAEMKDLALQNFHKAGKKLLNETLDEMNEQIREAAGEGRMSARFELRLTELVIKEELVESIKKYYLEKGFKVSANQFLFSIIFLITW